MNSTETVRGLTPKVGVVIDFPGWTKEDIKKLWEQCTPKPLKIMEMPIIYGTKN